MHGLKMHLMFRYNEFWIYLQICSFFKSILLYTGRVNKIMFTAIPIQFMYIVPLLSCHFSESQGWPLNRGRTVVEKKQTISFWGWGF